jgi:V8-like Glu-specific endopeptidase
MKLLRTVVVGLCLVAGAVLVAPTAANAAPVSGSTSVSSGLVPVFDPIHGGAKLLTPSAAATVIAGYWTPSRKAAATPVSAPPPAAGPSTPLQPSSNAAPRNIAEPVVGTAGEIGAAVSFANAEGKVFFHNPADGRDYACSGGAINSGKRRIVLTAGHCVHGGSGQQWMQNWVFYPGYQFGAGYAGAFPAYQLWAKSGWTNSSDRHYDYAFAITQNNSSGQRIVDAVGGNGLTVNPGRPFVTDIAYPVNFMNGEQQAFCQGTLSRRSIFNSDQQLNCDMRFGASGGPWLRDYSNSSGLGYAVANQSYSLHSDGSGPEYGPYYDSNTSSLYFAAENASP